MNLDYKEHNIFGDLSEYISFYKSLSLSIFPFATQGVQGIINLDSYLISSIQGTIESIKLVLEDGKINDAYSLTRKYHDSVVINIYEVQYLKDNFNIENFTVKKINDWLKNKEKLPRYDAMMKYIHNSTDLAGVNKLLDSDDRYNQIRSRCNDYTHYNLFFYMVINDGQLHLQGRLKALDQLADDLRNIFIKHFIWLFTLNGHYMCSSDYIDYLESGMTPEEGSQYWVAPFVQEAFDNIIAKHRNDLAIELKSVTCMKLI